MLTPSVFCGGLTAMTICPLSTCQVRARVITPVLVAVAMLMVWAPTTTAQDKDLAAARHGAEVIKYTSQAGPQWPAARLIDEPAAAGGWASADASLPQEIVVRLPASARFNTLVFNLDGAPRAEWAKEVSVYAADPFPTMGGWRLVGSVRLEPTPGDQTFKVDQADGRFIRLLITSTQSPAASRVALGRFGLFWR
jgi:hypothetical protein